jgi:glucarate dehydratase
MKIVDLVATPVTLFPEATWRWSQGTEPSFTRTILELRTDEGITGLGECAGGGDAVATIETLKQLVVGLDPFETGLVRRRLAIMDAPYAMSAIEMACLDVAGRATGRTVASLLGGALRDRVPMASYLFHRYASEDGRIPAVDSPERILERAIELTERNGHRTHKLKGGVFEPLVEYAALRLLRDRFPESSLVWDPNAAWSVETTIRIGRRLTADGFELQFLEDPCEGVAGMSRARAAIDIPFATNEIACAMGELAPAIEAGAVDVILADIGYWGGFGENLKMSAVAEAFNLGVGMHSDIELGIATAAMVHLACVLPNLTYAADAHYHDQVGDVITEPWVYRDGCFELPDSPGLGVELDHGKLDFHHRAYLEHGSANWFFDARRPGWDPTLPLF